VTVAARRGGEEERYTETTHSTLGLRVITQKKKGNVSESESVCVCVRERE